MTTPRLDSADSELLTQPRALADGSAAHERASAPARRWSRGEITGIAVLTGFVLVASAWRLGSTSLSNDEAATWAISGHSFADLLHVFTVSGGDRGAGLYYLVEHLWIQVVGTGEVALRSLSAMAAAAAIPPFYAVGRRLVERRTAGAGAVLFATSSFLLAYAHDARAYSFATLLVVLAAWAFVRAVESGAGRDWAIYAVMASLSIYAHWFAALVVLAEYASLLSLQPIRVAWRAVGKSVAILALLTSPIAFLVLFANNSGIDWIAPLSVGELRTTATSFTGTNSWPGQLVFLVVLVAGVVSTVEATRRVRALGTTAVPALVATWFLVPFLATIAVSAFTPLLISRYLIVALPGFALLLALGLTRLGRGRTVPLVAGVLVLVIVGAHGYRGVWTQTERENWRDIASTIGRDAHPADTIVVFPATTASAFAYYARTDPRLRLRSRPSWPPVAWNAPFDRSTANPTVLTTIGRVRSSVVWVVARDPGGPTVRKDAAGKPVLAELERALARRYSRVVPVEPFAQGTVFLVRYSRPRKR